MPSVLCAKELLFVQNIVCFFFFAFLELPASVHEVILLEMRHLDKFAASLDWIRSEVR